MLVKGRYLKKFNKFFFLSLVFLVSKTIVADSTKIELLNYNKSLDNSSALFIQSDGKTIQEGIIYVGHKRIKIDYTAPQKITIVISENKGMYVNHELMEAQYFNTNKSYVRIFFQILTGEDFFNASDVKTFKESIVIKNKFKIDDNSYVVEVIYEDDPIKIRKLQILENKTSFEIGFFNHNNIKEFKKSFFSLINPYTAN